MSTSNEARYSPSESRQIVEFIIGDFECTWDALAVQPSSKYGNRGNFLFALLSMILLEVACKLCKSDNLGQALCDLSKRLATRNKLYFTVLPVKPYTPLNFDLPSRKSNKAELIRIFFNLVRNGVSHLYNQSCIKLKGGNLNFPLTGAEHGRYLNKTFCNGIPKKHLSFFEDSNEISIIVRTDVLFLDIRDSIYEAKLLDRDLTLDHFGKRKQYDYDKEKLIIALKEAGHRQVEND